MDTSTVYFSDMRALPGTNLLIKLDRLIQRAGMDKIDFKDKFVAIKMHFGEPGNLAFLRPNWAKVVVDRIKAAGGQPFLTDCNTLYVGRRKNALDHLDAALENGFSPLSTGCQVLIADGLKGTDEVYVPVVNGQYVSEAKIGRAIMDADIFISLSHFKGHENTGFGGALKNIGMGCGSRAGKMEQHYAGKPTVNAARCTGCRICSRFCAHDALSFGEDKKAQIAPTRCVGCGRCISVCPAEAIRPLNSSANDELNWKMAEYSKAVLDGRPHFHISIVNQVSPYCDCHAENDMPIIPDVGMFASFDPVALDVACADACNRMPVIQNSLLGERLQADGAQTTQDHFHTCSPDTDWRECPRHAEKIGLGNQAYELITVQ